MYTFTLRYSAPSFVASVLLLINVLKLKSASIAHSIQPFMECISSSLIPFGWLTFMTFGFEFIIGICKFANYKVSPSWLSKTTWAVAICAVAKEFFYFFLFCLPGSLQPEKPRLLIISFVCCEASWCYCYYYVEDKLRRLAKRKSL